jgi:beta-lactamase class A
MFKKKIPLGYFALYSIIISACTFLAFSRISKTLVDDPAGVSSSSPNTDDNCVPNAKRLNGYTYIRPLLGCERECESVNKYSSLKSEIKGYIENAKQTGEFKDAGVYLEDCSNNDWMGINADGLYLPGSLLKVPTLITYLKMAEKEPGLLDKELLFNARLFPPSPKQTFADKTIVSGHKYKIRDLLYNMIAYSDNYSTWLLNSKMDVEVYKKVYAEIGLPTSSNYEYKVSAKDYSRLLKVLYDVGYLTINNSEYAMSLLAQTEFKDGLVKKLPPNVRIVHKFGEAGTREYSELHESGIVYIGNNSYLLTVMTRGKNVKTQAEVMSDISKMVYDHMIAEQGNKVPKKQ